NKKCIECQVTSSVRFRLLGDEKWKEIKARSLERESWRKDKEKPINISEEEIEEINISSANFGLVEAI
ncbi:10862_t:CDS:2, partial [Ambispora gerdemannii]